MNSLEYKFLADNKIDYALAIFKLNTIEYRHLSNAFDSLGEAYFNNKDKINAKNAFETALKLNPSTLVL